MATGTMGVKLHPKVVARIRELLRKDDVNIPMIAQRLGVSETQVRNIKHGRDSSHYAKKSRHPMQDEFDSVFDRDDDESQVILECPPEPEPQAKPVAKPKAVVDPFDPSSPALPKPKVITPETERLIIVDLRANIAPNIIARRHGVPLLDVESIGERVYWLGYANDPRVVKEFVLTHKEHMQALGPRLTADQLAILRPQIDAANEWLADILNIDLATADTVRKVVVSYHLEHGRTNPPKPPKPEPPKSPDPVATDVEDEIEAVVSTLFAKIEAIESNDDELEPLNALCLRFFHREPEPYTVTAWVNGDNDRNMKLETFDIDGQLVTTEKHFREYFNCFSA